MVSPPVTATADDIAALRSGRVVFWRLLGDSTWQEAEFRGRPAPGLLKMRRRWAHGDDATVIVSQVEVEVVLEPRRRRSRGAS